MTNEFLGGNELGPRNHFNDHRNGPSENISTSCVFKTADGKTMEIRDVWASNLDAEMELIRDLLDKYKYVAMVHNNLFSYSCRMVYLIFPLFCTVYSYRIQNFLE